MSAFGTGLPAVQQIPARTRAWERAVGGEEMIRAARAAEVAGFAWVSCSDHPAVPASRTQAMGATFFSLYEEWEQAGQPYHGLPAP